MKPDTCRGCALETLGEGFVPPQIPARTSTTRTIQLTEAPPPATGGLMIVGEAPGVADIRTEKPFQGQGGYFLDRLLRRTGIDRDAIALHTVISCRPPKGQLRTSAYRESAIYQCGPNLRNAIERAQPKVIVAFGDTALEALTGKRGIKRQRGFWALGPNGIPVMPTFHPAYLLPGRDNDELKKDRPARFTSAVIWDLLRAKRQAESPEPFRRLTTRYLLDPAPAEAAVFWREYQNAIAQDARTLLTYDIETPGKQPRGEAQIPMLEQPITRISFAWTAGYAMTVPWRPEYFETIWGLLGTTRPTTGWNSAAFDNPVLQFQGGRTFLQGPHYDMMRAWHVLQSDLPKGLEFVSSLFTDLQPWKDLSSTAPALYSATDSDAQIRDSYGIRESLQGPLQGSQWQIFEQLVMEIQPFLAACGQRGLPIDVEAQNTLQRELEDSLATRLTQVQALVPPDLYTEKIYVRKPARTHAEVRRPVSVKVCSCGFERPTVVHYRGTKNKPPCDGLPGTIVRDTTVYQALMDLDVTRGFQWIKDEISDCGFNPMSVAQVTAYAERFRHLQLLRASGVAIDGLDDTVLGHLIKRFGKDHPLYAAVRDIREQNKQLGTYVVGYRPDAEGLIHTKHNDNPSTLRLGSQDVNLQNVDANIKRTIRAKPGWCFVEVDSSAIEALMVGYAAEDPEYIRLAARGVHDFVNCKANGLDFDDDGIRRSKTEFAKSRKVKKMTVHLSNFGGTPFTMKKQAPETYTTLKLADTEQRFYFEVCPKIPEWQKRTRAIVARTNVLINPWGFHQYFYQVFDNDGPGPDFNRCLGAGPQSMAAMFMRENLWRLKDSEWAEFAGGNVSTHDSLGLIVPEALATQAADYLLGLMTRPIAALDNLRIGAEAKISPPGGTWAELQEYRAIKIPDPLALSTWHLQKPA